MGDIRFRLDSVQVNSSKIKELYRLGNIPASDMNVIGMKITDTLRAAIPKMEGYHTYPPPIGRGKSRTDSHLAGNLVNSISYYSTKNFVTVKIAPVDKGFHYGSIPLGGRPGISGKLMRFKGKHANPEILASIISSALRRNRKRPTGLRGGYKDASGERDYLTGKSVKVSTDKVRVGMKTKFETITGTLYDRLHEEFGNPLRESKVSRVVGEMLRRKNIHVDVDTSHGYGARTSKRYSLRINLDKKALKAIRNDAYMVFTRRVDPVSGGRLFAVLSKAKEAAKKAFRERMKKKVRRL